MRTRFFRSRLIAFSLITALTLQESGVFSTCANGADFEPYTGNITEDNSYQFLRFKKPSGSDVDTIRILDQENRNYERGDQNQAHNQLQIDTDHNRAQTMVDMLKDEQMQKALDRVNNKGKAILQDNPGLQSPGAVIAGAVALWYGRGIKLFKTSEKTTFYGKFEGRTRTGEFSMEAPLFNGRLRFSPDNGAEITVNRSISSVSAAEVVYSVQNHSMTTQMRQRLLPNVDFTFGSAQVPFTNQMDNRAGVYYNLNF